MVAKTVMKRKNDLYGLQTRRTIPFNFGPEHKEYIRRCRDNTYNILEGAVRSGKTIDNVFAFAHELKTTPDRIHLATGSTMANAKLNIGDANGFGLEYIFRGQCHWTKYKDNDALYICGPYTGYRVRIVIFAGGAKQDSYKKIRGEINRNCPDTPFPVIAGVDENQLTGNPVRGIPWETNYNFYPKGVSIWKLGKTLLGLTDDIRYQMRGELGA